MVPHRRRTKAPEALCFRGPMYVAGHEGHCYAHRVWRGWVHKGTRGEGGRCDERQMFKEDPEEDGDERSRWQRWPLATGNAVRDETWGLRSGWKAVGDGRARLGRHGHSVPNGGCAPPSLSARLGRPHAPPTPRAKGRGTYADRGRAGASTPDTPATRGALYHVSCRMRHGSWGNTSPQRPPGSGWHTPHHRQLSAIVSQGERLPSAVIPPPSSDDPHATPPSYCTCCCTDQHSLGGGEGVKKQQPDGMSHRGGRGLPCRAGSPPSLQHTDGEQ